MIGGVVRHGRTRRDSRALVNHLLKDNGARVELVHTVAPSLTAAVEDMELARDGSSAEAAFLHIHLSPARDMTRDELRQAAAIVIGHLEADGHQAALVFHEKPRRGGEGGMHAHLVLGRVGPDGQVLPSGFEKIRVETAMRIAEFELGEAPTLGRHHSSGVKWLRANGRADVADWMDAAHGPDPHKPGSAASPAKRQALARKGVDLPDVRDVVCDAWEASDGPQAFRAALRQRGMDVAPGQKPGLFVVSAGDAEIGRLDRLIKLTRRDVAARMGGFDHAANPAPAPEVGRPDAGPESRIRPEPGRSSSGPAAAAAAVVVGATGGGWGEPGREASGHSRDDRAGPAPATSESRGSPREARVPRLEEVRLSLALKGFEPTPATKAAAAEIKIESLSGRFSRLTLAVLDRQIGNGLDRLQRLAWEVRDVINDVRLRIRFGQAEQRTLLPEPEPMPTTPEDRLAALRTRIQVRHRDAGPDDDAPEWTPPRPF